MARPQKDGVGYFPFDTDFFQDKKVRLIRGEFGPKGVIILIALFCEIYRTNGYFKPWDNEDCIFMADAVGCGIGPENIKQVVLGCLRRSIFNNGVFQMFGILTSAGIQRRYIRMFPSRKHITMISEYLLLDVEDEDDVPAGVLDRLALKSINSNQNPDKNIQNPHKNIQNPAKGKEIKEITMQSLAAQPPSFEEVKQICREIDVLFDPSYFFDYYTARGWRDRNGVELVDLAAALRGWVRREWQYPPQRGNHSAPGQNKSAKTAGSSIDIVALDAYINGQFADGEEEKV